MATSLKVVRSLTYNEIKDLKEREKESKEGREKLGVCAYGCEYMSACVSVWLVCMCVCECVCCLCVLCDNV